MNPTDISVRCCIAGGGPAGMMLGFLLARAGIPVMVLRSAPRSRSPLPKEAGKPAGTSDTGTMGGRGGGMMQMMNGVDPARMKRMVENCNRMMESIPMRPSAPAAATPEKKG